MYKNDELDVSNELTSKEEKLLDTMDPIFFNYLYELNKLFKQNKYKSKIGSKTSPDSVGGLPVQQLLLQGQRHQVGLALRGRKGRRSQDCHD